MSYKDEYHPGVKKDLKQLERAVVKEVFESHIEKVLQHPESGERLRGELSGIFSYHFRKNKIDYRIAYTVDEARKIIYVLRIAKRENFYEVLKRRFT
ncbi:MAG: type II toxin-antitoxin system RelE/ParE family toxin [Alphaproteobacteria bacterium]|uniref:Type II toxin-antitoxin system RelE/ParE family toxin n=1 Tax=Candidatus Nitrobium versatile TaxID=2884831 RepID=A0A953J4X7_9BACT|nr:type II toxin-antitoxin system RelE/ParE family toxin [Candidatus Nitrobium versatile]